MKVLLSLTEWATVGVLTFALLMLVGLPTAGTTDYIFGFVGGAFITAFLGVFAASQLYRPFVGSDESE